MESMQIKNGIYWVGAIDWCVRDFHGYSTPSGSTYNAFLVVDEKIALFDTVKKPFKDDLLKQISQVIDPGKIGYIIVNHVELDHTGALPEIVEAVKPEKIICSAQGKKALLAHFHREDWPYEVVKTGDSISLGTKTVQFIETRMLHWPDSMISYIPEEKLLISQDGFGQHWATSERYDDEVDQSKLMRESAKYYANILLPCSALVQKVLTSIKEMGIEIDMIAPDHGVIWRSDPGKIIDAWDRWSQQQPLSPSSQEGQQPLSPSSKEGAGGRSKALVVYDTMWQSTELMARAVADGIQSMGVSVQLINLASSHRSDVMTELLDARAIAMGSSTLNNNMLPRMADMLTYMKGLRPAPKIAAAFGSYGWGGEAVKQINAVFDEMKFEVLDEGLRVNYVPTAEDLAACAELGARIGHRVIGKIGCSGDA